MPIATTMTRERQENKWGTEEVAPLFELTQPPSVSATGDDSSCANDNDNEHEEHVDDDQVSMHSCNSWNNGNDDDDSNDDEDYFEPWDDRDPQEYSTRQDAVYTCPPKYSTFLLVGIAAMFFILLSELTHALVRDIGYVGSVVQEKKRLQGFVFMYFCLNWMALFLVGMILPRKYEILSESSTIIIGTTFTSFRFDDIRSAQRSNSLYNSDTTTVLKRLRFDFTTDCANRVVIKRGGHKWEVACSPKDPDEFVEAIRSICNSSNPNHASAEEV